MYICITGLRSVGKSTLAQSLADQLGLSYHDTDVMADRRLTQNGSSFLDEMKQRRHHQIYEAILSALPMALDDPHGCVIAAGWGCFQQPKLAKLLTDSTFVVAVIPSADPEQAAAQLYPRERLRPHFDYLNDADLMELCKRDAQNGIALLAQHSHTTLLVDSGDAVTVNRQMHSLLANSGHTGVVPVARTARRASRPIMSLLRRRTT
jgi:shikimate kinase